MMPALQTYREFCQVMICLAEHERFEALSQPLVGTSQSIMSGLCLCGVGEKLQFLYGKLLLEACRKMDVDPVRLLEASAKCGEHDAQRLSCVYRFNGLSCRFQLNDNDCLCLDNTFAAVAEFLSRKYARGWRGDTPLY